MGSSACSGSISSCRGAGTSSCTASGGSFRRTGTGARCSSPSRAGIGGRGVQFRRLTRSFRGPGVRRWPVAITRIQGDVLDHEIFWLSALGGLNVAILGAAVSVARQVEAWEGTPRCTRAVAHHDGSSARRPPSAGPDLVRVEAHRSADHSRHYPTIRKYLRGSALTSRSFRSKGARGATRPEWCSGFCRIAFVLLGRVAPDVHRLLRYGQR